MCVQTSSNFLLSKRKIAVNIQLLTSFLQKLRAFKQSAKSVHHHLSFLLKSYFLILKISLRHAGLSRFLPPKGKEGKLPQDSSPAGVLRKPPVVPDVGKS